ncbi:MAG: hypothetical protein IJK18_01470 [Clostridia bacterium]|nr:hypothetical protein [Clostridia bacterium]
MIEYKSREVFKQLIYIITISMAVIGVLFIPQIIFSRVKLSKTNEQKQSIEIAKTELVSKESLIASKKVTSRNGEDIRKSSKISEDEKASKIEKDDNKNLVDNKEDNKAETKKEDKKSDASKNENKKAKSESKKSEKQETKQKETKKESSKDVAKTESKKTEKKNEVKKEEKTDTIKKYEESKKEDSKQNDSKKKEKSSEENTKKTTEKNDSSKEETTTNKENKKSTTKTVSISKVKISKSMNLTKRTGLSRKDFIKLMSGVRADTSGFFEKNAGKIYDLCEKYSINEIFFCGLISAESGWNIASNHRRTHNYISLMRNGKLISYGSVNEGLEVAAQKLHYNYLTPGGKFYHGKTLAGVKTCFCPSSSWVGLVYGRMRQIL